MADVSGRCRSRSPARAGSRDRSLQAVLEVARRAALEAGAVIKKTWWLAPGSEVKLTKSNAVDLVTDTDQQCEDLVTRIIRESYPDDRIIGEESSGSEKYAALTDAPTWTIDPIDGTTNFVHRFAQSCVIISFLEAKEVRVAVVYDPIADELFSATKGGGAYLENPAVGRRRLQAPRVTSLSKAVVSMEVGYGRDETSVKVVTEALAGILSAGVRTVRMAGSSGLNMAYVAAGRFSAAFEAGAWERGRGPFIWDFAAGKLIVSESGAVTRDLGAQGQGELDLMGRSQFSASTPELADEILAVLAKSKAK